MDVSNPDNKRQRETGRIHLEWHVAKTVYSLRLL